MLNFFRRNDKTKSVINIGGTTGEQLRTGRAVFICIVTYRPDDDQLDFVFPDHAEDGLPRKEIGWAIIKRFMKTRSGNA